MSKPIAVIGDGRCGSSMVMQMLNAGGWPCVGQFPDFEEYWTIREPRISQKWISLDGDAVKFVSPFGGTISHECRLRPKEFEAVIYCRREPLAQAQSTVKFLRFFGADVPAKAIMAMRDNMIKARPVFDAFNQSIERERLVTLDFESVIVDPESTASTLAELLHIVDPCRRFDREAAAAAVRDRTPGVYQGMMEIELVEGSEGNHRR